jgi:hypothetical protein
LGHLWCSCPSNLCSNLGEMGSLGLDLRNMDFFFSLILLLLFPQQLQCLLRINITSHCSIFMSSLPFLYSLSLFFIIRLSHQNYSSGCPSLWLFILFRIDVCRVQRSFVFNKPLPQIFFFFFCPLEVVYLFLLLMWFCSF